MVRITIEAAHADGEPRRWTLRERIVTEHLDSRHYADQLIERLRWATADAEALEREPSHGPARHERRPRYGRPATEPDGGAAARRRHAVV